jgi:DUF917 family protein
MVYPPEIMRTQEALKVCGPAAFGYEDLAFHPLEKCQELSPGP